VNTERTAGVCKESFRLRGPSALQRDEATTKTRDAKGDGDGRHDQAGNEALRETSDQARRRTHRRANDRQAGQREKHQRTTDPRKADHEAHHLHPVNVHPLHRQARVGHGNTADRASTERHSTQRHSTERASAAGTAEGAGQTSFHRGRSAGPPPDHAPSGLLARSGAARHGATTAPTPVSPSSTAPLDATHAADAAPG
jgi:hypothetical protein